MVAVFQPHRYSRTAELWREFADAFDDADLLVLSDIYPAGEAPRPGITGKLLGRCGARPAIRGVRWRGCRPSTTRSATSTDALRPGDLCMTLGAGDITTLGERLLESRRALDRSDASAPPASADRG